MADPTAGQPALLAIALRGGDSLTLYADYLHGRDESIPLIELVWVGLVPDPIAPFDRPWTVPPALAVHLRDGRQRIYAPADPPDGPRMMEAIVARRPDMRMPFPPVPPPAYSMPPGMAPWAPPAPPPYPPPIYAPPPSAAPTTPLGAPAPPGPAGAAPRPVPLSSMLPPPPGFASPMPGFGPGWASPPPGVGYSMPYGAGPIPRSSSNETLLAGISHLSVFFAPVILPLIVWLTTRQSSPYASYQAKQAFVFHLFFSAVAFATGVGAYALIFSSLVVYNPARDTSAPPASLAGLFVIWAALGLLSLVNIIYSIVGAVQSFQGKPFHYPLLGRL